MKIRSRSSNAWIYILVVAGCVLVSAVIIGSWLLWLLFTEEKTRVFLNSEAYYNRWLAISKIGEKYGVSVHRDAILDAKNMPVVADTIILEDVGSAIVDESVSVALEQWVLQGGTLIYRVPTTYTDEDPLRALDTRYFPNKFVVFEELERTFEVFRWRIQSREKSSCRPIAIPIWFAEGDAANLGFSTLRKHLTHNLKTDKSPFAEDIVTLSETYFLQLNWGQGKVYFVTDLDLWSNHHADCADNAYVFLRLVRGPIDPIPFRTSDVSVWIVPPVRTDTPHLLGMVWDYYSIPIIGILLTFLVAMISRNVRSSPAQHAIPIPRRATIDYVSSESEFSWRKKDITRFFQAFLWIVENPKGVFGPRTTVDAQQTNPRTNDDHPNQLNVSPMNEEDLVVNVRKLQAELRRNMQPSLRKS